MALFTFASFISITQRTLLTYRLQNVSVIYFFPVTESKALRFLMFFSSIAAYSAVTFLNWNHNGHYKSEDSIKIHWEPFENGSVIQEGNHDYSVNTALCNYNKQDNMCVMYHIHKIGRQGKCSTNAMEYCL